MTFFGVVGRESIYRGPINLSISISCVVGADTCLEKNISFFDITNVGCGKICGVYLVSAGIIVQQSG